MWTSWTDRVKNEILHRIEKATNFLKKRKR